MFDNTGLKKAYSNEYSFSSCPDKRQNYSTLNLFHNLSYNSVYSWIEHTASMSSDTLMTEQEIHSWSSLHRDFSQNLYKLEIRRGQQILVSKEVFRCKQQFQFCLKKPNTCYVLTYCDSSKPKPWMVSLHFANFFKLSSMGGDPCLKVGNIVSSTI